MWLFGSKVDYLPPVHPTLVPTTPLKIESESLKETREFVSALGATVPAKQFRCPVQSEGDTGSRDTGLQCRASAQWSRSLA